MFFDSLHQRRNKHQKAAFNSAVELRIILENVLTWVFCEFRRIHIYSNCLALSYKIRCLTNQTIMRPLPYTERTFKSYCRETAKSVDDLGTAVCNAF